MIVKIPKIYIPRDIIVLSLAFFFIFSGFNSAQFFVTNYFDQIGIPKVGFNSLILIYLSFIIFNPFAAFLISKKGSKLAMVIGSLGYALYILSLLLKSINLIYLSSVILGATAALLWTGQNIYLIKISDKKTYGQNSGFFYTLLNLGSTLGILIAGILVQQISFKSAFSLLMFFPFIGFLILFHLRKIPSKVVTYNQFATFKKAAMSKTALKFALVFFAYTFIFGLVIGIIPIQINQVAGIGYVTALSSLYYLIPIIFSFTLGKYSDIKGRKIIIISSFLASILGLLVLYLSQTIFSFVLGVSLLAFSFAAMNPAATAVVGDVASEDNLESLTALFWMARNIGVVIALIISGYLEVKLAYLISILVIIVCAIIFGQVLKLELKEIKCRISQEMV